jgi:hypothetical protein
MSLDAFCKYCGNCFKRGYLGYEEILKPVCTSWSRREIVDGRIVWIPPIALKWEGPATHDAIEVLDG